MEQVFFRKYNKIIEEREEISRNVNWKLKSFKWDNLFNYGEGNSIDFENLNGIIGVFGKNFSGKSSIIDAALYTLFNTTSKNERKNLNVINQHQEACEDVHGGRDEPGRAEAEDQQGRHGGDGEAREGRAYDGGGG